MFKLTSNSDSEPVEAVKETFDNETNNLNGCKSLTEVEKINESMDDVNESIEDEPQEQSIVNTEENQVTGENNVTEENKANEKNKVAEEIKTTEENKVTEGSKVTEPHKVTEENKITEVARENEVFHENEIDDSFRGFDKSSEDAFRIIDKVRSLIKTEDEKVLKQRALMKDEPLDIDFYPAGTTEALGKGKRARVPNKRYSDILLSPHSRKSGLENGNYEKYDYENNSDNSGKDEPGLSIIGPSSSGSTLKKRKMSSDLSGTKYLRSPKLTSPKVSSPKLTNLKGNRYKARNSRVWQTKEGLHDTADSPPKNKTPKGKAPMMKDVEKKSADPPSTKGRRGRKKRLPAAHKTPVSSPAATNNTTSKKRTIKLSSITNSEEKEINFMDNYLQNLSYGYNTLLYVFQYLKVQDLLRAGCVCSLWRDLASHRLLWRTVRMKNSQVHSFEGLANSLKKHGTVHLDLRKMLLPNGGDEIWPEFSQAIAKVETLRRIELCRCPSSVVENLGASNPLLEVINAVTIKCESMNLEPLRALKQIKELRLKSTGGLILSSNIDALKDMNSLKYLSLTSIRDLDKINLIVIAELSNLESLELGECTDFPKSFGGEVLLKLRKLERLRLEKGQGNCHTFEILDAVKQMDSLEQLELVNFDIKAGFDKALGTCLNIKKFLIIPTYISQSATTNHMVLGGVIRLQKTLSHFVWGVTLELLRVTELFVDQCEDSKEKKDKRHTGNGDCIPVLKPIPLIVDKDMKIPPALEPPQVEILALPSLQKLLMQNLPATRVKILKIPFHATWRQSIMDSVN